MTLKRWLTVMGATVVTLMLWSQGAVLLLVTLLVVSLVALHRHRRARSRDETLTVADYVERHSYPSDTVADFVASEAGGASLADARRLLAAWKDGYLAGERARRRLHQ